MITEAYVAGLTKDNARKLLDRAADLGLPASVVRTVDGGFIVPGVLVEDAPEPDAQDESDTNDAPKRRTARKAATKSADDSTADAVASEE